MMVILVLGNLTSCNKDNNQAVPAPTPPATEAIESKEMAMGTLIHQKVYADKASGEAAMAEVIQRLQSLEALWSFNRSEGEIYDLNQQAGKGKVQLDPLTIKVLEKSQQVAALSSGVFDVTIGPLVKSWGIGSDHERIPSSEELKKLVPLTNYQDLILDEQTAYLKNPGQMVDLGGIAKGYAGDEAIAIYQKHGIQSAFISLGGNVVTLGNKPDGSPWKVGIMNPRSKEDLDGPQVLGAISVTNKAVVTAGDGERYFIRDGKRYHHILDPRTGYPAETDLMSVTLIMDASFDADALDTAVYILGREKGMELIKQVGGIEAVFITTDKKIFITDRLKETFTMLEGTSEYQLVENK